MVPHNPPPINCHINSPKIQTHQFGSGGYLCQTQPSVFHSAKNEGKLHQETCQDQVRAGTFSRTAGLAAAGKPATVLGRVCLGFAWGMSLWLGWMSMLRSQPLSTDLILSCAESVLVSSF